LRHCAATSRIVSRRPAFAGPMSERAMISHLAALSRHSSADKGTDNPFCHRDGSFPPLNAAKRIALLRSSETEMSMMTKPSFSRRSFSASASTPNWLGMILVAPSSGRRGLRYWIITRVILRRRHVVECARDNRSAIGSETTHVGSGLRCRCDRTRDSALSQPVNRPACARYARGMVDQSLGSANGDP
jgi:hypothetical protein